MPPSPITRGIGMWLLLSNSRAAREFVGKFVAAPPAAASCTGAAPLRISAEAEQCLLDHSGRRSGVKGVGYEDFSAFIVVPVVLSSCRGGRRLRRNDHSRYAGRVRTTGQATERNGCADDGHGRRAAEWT